jgi:hypothetical protein
MVYDSYGGLERYNGPDTDRLVPSSEAQSMQAKRPQRGVQMGGGGLRYGDEISKRQSWGTTGTPRGKTMMFIAFFAYFRRLGRYPRTYIYLQWD